jgi:hypothetical protein
MKKTRGQKSRVRVPLSYFIDAYGTVEQVTCQQEGSSCNDGKQMFVYNSNICR